MGRINDNDIKRIFRLKKKTHEKPTVECVLEDVIRTSSERARSRIIAKTIIVLTEAILLASLIYLYYFLK